MTLLFTSHALAVNVSDGSLNSAERPVKSGEYFTAYVTGQGLVDHPVATGAAAPSSPFSLPLAPVQVRIGGQAADIQFAGLAPGFVGLLQLNVLVPNVAAGEQKFEVVIGGVPASPTVISVGGQ
jgi:adhesin/invasin